VTNPAIGISPPVISWYISRMKAEDAIATLRKYEAALRARGVIHAALFGSIARGDNRSDSDIDIRWSSLRRRA
jgi:predicted nucleotidyltransferase